MRLLLVNPPHPHLVDPLAYPPSGLYYLKAAVERFCPWVTVAVLNCARETDEATLSALADADIVGWTADSLTWRKVVELARRARRSGLLQIVGGVHPTVTGQDDDAFDAIFIGAAERSLVTYLREVRDGTATYRYHTERGSIDDLPPPEPCLGKRLNVGGGQRTAVVFTSRGCSHDCAFCAIRRVHPRLQLRSVESVRDELVEIVKVGVRDVRFMDDSFTAVRPRTLKLCEALLGMRLRWACTVRADQVDAELLSAMRRAGCTEVGFGAESFDPAVLRAVGKRTNPCENAEAVLMAHEAGLKVHLFLMISTPGESLGTVGVNIEALEALRGNFHRCLLSTLMPYPGSAIWNRPADFGVELLSRRYWEFNQYMYQRRGGEVVESEPWSPLLICGLAREQQLDNIRVMREYVAGLAQANKGRFD